jgi:hypothetical protein
MPIVNARLSPLKILELHAWAYRDSVTDRLTRVGVTTQKIEDFSVKGAHFIALS